MNNKKSLIIGVLVVLIILILVWFTQSQNSMTDNDGMMTGENIEEMEEEVDEMMNSENLGQMDEVMEGSDTKVVKGSYEVYAPEKLAQAETGDVVLFFRADWCPTCRALDADIRSNLENIPTDVTILDVDYDNSTALKQKYGVTYQHTLVQVDASGNQIIKWTSSPTLMALLKNIK